MKKLRIIEATKDYLLNKINLYVKLFSLIEKINSIKKLGVAKTITKNVNLNDCKLFYKIMQLIKYTRRVVRWKVMPIFGCVL